MSRVVPWGENDGRTDGHMTKVIFAFRNFVKGPKQLNIKFSNVWLTVHRSSMWNKKPTRCHLVLYLFLLISCSACFGPPCAHFQALTT